MHPIGHFVVNSIVGLILYLFNVLTFEQMLVVIVAGVLIDFDHLVEAVKKEFRTLLRPSVFFNLKRFNEECKKSKQHYLLVFHTIEVIALIALLSFWVPILLYIALGFFVHVLTDQGYASYLTYKLGRKPDHVHKSFFLTPYILHGTLKTDNITWKNNFQK